MLLQRPEPPSRRGASLGSLVYWGRRAPPAQAVIQGPYMPPVTSWLVVFLPSQCRCGAASTKSSDSYTAQSGVKTKSTLFV